MILYAVVWEEIESGGLTAIYSTRELAENDWEMRNQDGCGYHRIEEFELDFDPKANEPDIDRRPVYGPRTYLSHILNEAFGRLCLENLMAPSPSMSILKPLPERSGNKIQFFS